MSDAQQVRRAVERFQRGRRWEHSAFPTSSGGLLHTPYPRLGGGQPRTSGGGGDITIGQAPIGEIVRAEVTGHLSPGGEPIVWSSVQHRLGFASATFPNVELRLPHSAVYGIEGDFSWTDGFVFGGRVSLRLNGTGIPGLSPIRAGDDVDNAVGRTFTLAQEFVANEGDRLMVVVDHAGDAHHDLHGVIEVATKEPLRVRVVGDGPESGPAYAAGSDAGTAGTLSVDPSGVQVGDTLVAGVMLRRSGGTGTAPSGPAGWNLVALFNNPGAGYQRTYWEKPSADAGDVSGPLVWTRDGADALAVVVYGVSGPVVRHDFTSSAQGGTATRTYQGYSPPSVPATVVNLLTHINALVSADGADVQTEHSGPGSVFGWAAAATGSWQAAAPSASPGGQATQAGTSSFQAARFIYVAP